MATTPTSNKPFPDPVPGEPKNHSVTVTIISESHGVVNQEVICKEYAGSREELVAKHMPISAAVIGAVSQVMETFKNDILKSK